MTDQLGSLDLSRDLQTSSVIIFVISICLVFQMYKDVFSKILHRATKGPWAPATAPGTVHTNCGPLIAPQSQRHYYYTASQLARSMCLCPLPFACCFPFNHPPHHPSRCY